jgi:hypothetical protein
VRASSKNNRVVTFEWLLSSHNRSAKFSLKTYVLFTASAGSYIPSQFNDLVSPKSDVRFVECECQQADSRDRFLLPAKLPANRNEKVRAGSSRARLITYAK